MKFELTLEYGVSQRQLVIAKGEVKVIEGKWKLIDGEQYGQANSCVTNIQFKSGQ